MSRAPTVVGFAGSLNEKSSTKIAIDFALAAAHSAGAVTSLIELRSISLPLFDPATHNDAAQAFAEQLYAADAIILSTPLYHGSLSGAFKNALDWLELLNQKEPSYLSGKPVGLIATSGGSHALQAIVAMEHVVRALRGWTVPMVVAIERASQLLAQNDERTLRQLKILGEEVTLAARRFAMIPSPPASE